MIIGRRSLIKFVRKRLDEWKKVEVPRMIREGNLETLARIVEQEDYSPFRRKTQPEFLAEELDLYDQDDVEACALYVWGNPFVLGGDTEFFKDIYEFPELLRDMCGEWGEELATILTSIKSTQGMYTILSKQRWDGCRPMTLEEFLYPQMVQQR